MNAYKVSGLLFIAIVLFEQCSSQYDKGESEFNLRKYDEAKSHYELVEEGSNNYKNAQLRILQIDSIIEKQTFEDAKGFFDKKMYSDAETSFLRIDSTSKLYNESKVFLKRIDSVRHARQLENTIREQQREIKEKNLAKVEDAKALKQIKQKVRVLFDELITFKDKSDFHTYGFGVGYKYNSWLTNVKALKDAPEAKLLSGHGFVVGDLEMLGLEYVSSSGKETEYSRWARKVISDGLKK